MTLSDSIQEGHVVLFHYTLSNSEGEVLDSSRDGGTMPYLHGYGNIVPGLERQMTGRSPGDRFDAIVPPEEGYGLPSDPLPPIPLDELPPGIETGMSLMAETEDGQHVPIFVLEVRDTDALLTPSHPLAGETLHFDIEIMSLRASTEEELEHGHPHGPDGMGGHDHSHDHDDH